MSSVQEVAPSRKDHRHPERVRGFDDLLVAFGAAGLYDGLDASFCQRLHTVGEGEERVASRYRAPRPLASLLDSELGGVHPATLAAPDTDRGPLPGEHDRVAQ